ncbi:unnamed protein product [Allacma fusca]|uniref:Peptidase S8/S53 domain-containing protein n=1 Tax=Allacma fusca TaxID=39272 RepID=A0A8J2KQX6_9HEXA|nr:unnamed protein product [Allacma fusca]
MVQSVVYPGGLPDIFSVGATNYLDEVSPFSSSGSGANETVKPEIVAPGIDIWSSILGQHIMYLSGTSMAAPHVTGVVALLLSKNPNLTNKEIWDILIKSTDPVTITKTPDQCESIPLEKYPNNRAGYGRLNALKAINNVKLP